MREAVTIRLGWEAGALIVALGVGYTLGVGARSPCPEAAPVVVNVPQMPIIVPTADANWHITPMPAPPPSEAAEAGAP